MTKSADANSEAEKSKQWPLYALGEKIVTTSTSKDKRTLKCSGSTAPRYKANGQWALSLTIPDDLDPAAIMENLFERNGWGDSWRDGIYGYVHYHSRIHEVLGIARGDGTVRFGGNNGRTFHLKAGDVAVLPAGTGHQCLVASADFLVVGAYPPSGTYDECTKSEDHARALKMISKVGRPRKDPVYGLKGPLLSAWKPAR
jgi:uncharacterized protein YjlB